MSSRPTLLDPAALSLCPTEVVFWSGAGISADAPTSGPVGNTLADRALRYAFATGTASTIRGYYAELRIDRTRRTASREGRPRLETLLDVVFRVHGEAVLDDLLSDLATAHPNALHGFFAEHLLHGGRHVTANFDTCIEQTAPPGATVEVVHYHGSFGGSPLGATLERIERGFPPDIRSDLDRVILDPSAKLVVFAGYSGLDFFDVDPFLRSFAPGALAGRAAVWINHEIKTPPQRLLPDRKQLRWLAAAGASTSEIKAPTREILEELASSWGLRISDPPGSAVGWRPGAAVADDQKERATLELYSLMNLHCEVRPRVRVPANPAQWEMLAQTLWAEGRYRAAGEAWERARAGASETARRERRGAILWIRGEFGKARRELLSALSDGAATLEERLLVAELLARVLSQMRRFPDSRLVPTRRARRVALAELPDPAELASAGQPLGTHLRIRVASARAALGAKATNEHPVESFGEYEALCAQLNYRHGALRERLGRERVDPTELRQLHADFAAIGADGDAARATLLGGVSVFGWREVLRSARRLDVTRWHRDRLVLASLLASLRRKIRHR